MATTKASTKSRGRATKKISVRDSFRQKKKGAVKGGDAPNRIYSKGQPGA